MSSSLNTGKKRSFDGTKHDHNASKRRRSNSEKGKGNIDTPREIKIYKFAKNRASEINALLKNVNHVGGNRVIFQKLPRHLRRRAMSHNIKRLPRRVRDAAIIEYKDRPITGSKKPSRKHRRRSQNLLSDYYRRQRRIKWLESHIWHAKRFHMTEKWGYKLPVRPTDRSYRACYRATANHCLLQDISYECCIEIYGDQEIIVKTFSHLLTVETGATVGGATVIKGNRQGENILYQFDEYPYKAIGHVSFMWKPGNHKIRQLWVWCHPSCYDAIWSEITGAFRSEDSQIELTEKPENCQFHKRVKVGEVTVTSLKDHLIKFRLIGPLSQAILNDALKPATVLNQHGDEYWWQKYHKENPKQHTQQFSSWEDLRTCQSPAEAPPNMILSLTVRDPRLFLPEMKTKIKPMHDGLKTLDVKTSTTPDSSQSALWNEDVRHEVKATKITEADLNKMRSNLIVPGTTLNLGKRESRIPVILIQKPGVRDSLSSGAALGYGSGWDVIVPSGWGMAFHLALVYRGCRTGGLQEAESLSAESGRVYSPLGLPDTPAGKAEQTDLSTELLAKYKRYPLDKRPNFVKLGTASPFSCSWEGLVETWIAKTQMKREIKAGNDDVCVYVLRNKKHLRLISKVIAQRSQRSKNRLKIIDYDANIKKLQTLMENSVNCLVPIQVRMKLRGLPSRCAVVCIPSADDTKRLSENSKYGGPKQMPHNDRSKEKAKNKTNYKTEFIPSARVELDANNRETIGFVNSGRFIFGKGLGSGIAFCSMIGLFALIQSIPCDHELCVLIRNPTSLQYRIANISVLM